MEMKNLQIVIDLKDLYVEAEEYGESENFNDTLKKEIQSEVINTIIKGFTPEVIKALKDETIEKFKEKFETKISERIEKSIDRGIFTDKLGKTYSVDSFVQTRLESALINNRNIMERIDRNVKTSIEMMQQSLEKRYDLEFASAIIKNMKDANLLKEGAE